MKLIFTVNLYDKDGDKYLDGICLFLEDTPVILKIDGISELENLIDNLQRIKSEIKENYNL